MILPDDDLNGHEQELRRKAALRFRCVFCSTDCSGLDGLKEHCSICSEHPLSKEVARLQAGIRAHRDQRGDDRCWRDNETLYALLPEGYTPPERDTLVELENCRRYIESCYDPRVEYVSPQREIERLAEAAAKLKTAIQLALDSFDRLPQDFLALVKQEECARWLISAVRTLEKAIQ